MRRTARWGERVVSPDPEVRISESALRALSWPSSDGERRSVDAKTRMRGIARPHMEISKRRGVVKVNEALWKTYDG